MLCIENTCMALSVRFEIIGLCGTVVNANDDKENSINLCLTWYHFHCIGSKTKF